MYNITIPNYSFTELKEITEGWSYDKKYLAKDQHNKSYLIRLTKETLDRKNLEYTYLKELRGKVSDTSLLLDVGNYKEDWLYGVYTWVEGVNLEDNIMNFSDDEQFRFGYEAGQKLKAIHSVPNYHVSDNWDKRYLNKLKRKVKAYKESNLKYPKDDNIIGFIEDNAKWIAGRPQCFQHGDYHIGNQLLTPSGGVGIIDYNRWDVGDPWEEFNRITFSMKVSYPYSRGYVNGYFDNKVPDLFMRLMTLYIAVNTLSALPWAVAYGEKETENMFAYGEEIFSCFDNFNTYIPKWFKGEPLL